MPSNPTKLATVLVPIDQVRVHPENPRRGNVEAIADSLDKHGQYAPIVVQKSTGYVLAGNHRLRAAQHLGWTRILAVMVDVDDDEARRILLVDNRTSDIGEYDDRALAELLDSLDRSDSGLDGTGYDPIDLDDLLAKLAESDAANRRQGAYQDGVNLRQTPTLAESADRYAAMAVRSIVVSYVGEQFLWVTDRLATLRAEYGVEANAQAILRLLADRFPELPPPALEDGAE